MPSKIEVGALVEFKHFGNQLTGTIVKIDKNSWIGYPYKIRVYEANGDFKVYLACAHDIVSRIW
jgi:hypothetical protein